MSAQERAAELREQAGRLDGIAKLEAKAADAKAAYQENRDDPKAKAAHRRAADELGAARNELRASQVVVASGEGSTTIQPASVNAKGA